MDELIAVIWYLAWLIAIPAFIVAWLATANTIFSVFKSLGGANSGKLNALKNINKKESGNDQFQSDTEAKVSATKIRKVGISIFLLCFIIISLININGMAPV